MRASSSTSAAAVRRLPLQQSLASLTSGEGSTSLPSRVKALHFSFVQKNAPSGPREFIRSIAPRIAYANPTLPFHINRIRDPRSKHLNPKSPDSGAATWDNGMPPAELRVEIENGDTQTINIDALSSSEILQELLKAAGGPVDLLAGVSNPNLGGEGAGSGENTEGGEKSMAEMLNQGADTTYADIGKAPVVGESPKAE